MERERVKSILRFCRDIDGEIKHNAKIIQDYEDRYYLPGGGTLDGMPRSKYKTSSPTETVALSIPDFVRGEVCSLNEQNEQLGNLKAAIMQEINKLSLHQKTILYDYYIRGMQWVQISTRIHYGTTQCKKIRNRGLDNLANNFSKIPLIANFNYPC